MFSLLGKERNEYFIPDPIGRRELEMDSPFDTTCQVRSPAWPLRIDSLGLCRWQKLLGEKPRMEFAVIWTDMCQSFSSITHRKLVNYRGSGLLEFLYKYKLVYYKAYNIITCLLTRNKSIS
jgi:hypothetical protein